MLAAAKRPTLYVGVGLRRHGLTELVVRLAEHLRLPLATDVLGKAAIPESHPQFAGVYMGVLGDPAVREMLDGSDCVIVSYGMLEAIDRPRNYYARRSWDYAAMARTLGASAERVTTPAELEGAMARAEADPGAFLIEAVTARDDLSPVMARIRAHLHTPPKPRSL